MWRLGFESSWMHIVGFWKLKRRYKKTTMIDQFWSITWCGMLLPILVSARPQPLGCRPHPTPHPNPTPPPPTFLFAIQYYCCCGFPPKNCRSFRFLFILIFLFILKNISNLKLCLSNWKELYVCKYEHLTFFWSSTYVCIQDPLCWLCPHRWGETHDKTTEFSIL